MSPSPDRRSTGAGPQGAAGEDGSPHVAAGSASGSAPVASSAPGAGVYSISWTYLAISVALSLASMGVVLYFTYTPGVLEHLKPKRLPGLFIAIAVSLLRVWVAAVRLRFLADRQVSLAAAVRLVLSWDFASSVTPSTIGGAPAATLFMTREGIPLGRSTIIILYGVLLDQMWYALAVPILLLSGLFLPVVPAEAGLVGRFTMLLIYAGLLAYGLVLAYGLLVNPRVIRRLVNRTFRLPVLRRVRGKIEAESEHLEAYSHELRQKPRSFLVRAYMLTVATWLCRIALPVIVVLSLLPAQEVLLVLRSLSMHLAFLVVPTPGGSGGVEGLFYLFIGPLVEREGFVGLAVFAWRIISYYISIGLGVVAVSWYLNSKGARPGAARNDGIQTGRRQTDGQGA